MSTVATVMDVGQVNVEAAIDYYVNEAAWKMVRNKTADYQDAVEIIGDVFEDCPPPDDVGQRVMNRRSQILVERFWDR